MGALTLLGAIILVSVAGFARPALIQRALLRPYQVARGSGYFGLISSGFVHADVGHLLFNLITFFSFALPLEHMIGTVRLLALYFTGLIVSGVGTCLQHRDEPEYASLGASGAILAVLFASIVYFPTRKLLIMPLPIPIPAPLFAVGYLAYSYYAARNMRGNVNHDAHIFGALAGVAFVAVTDWQAVLDLRTLIPG